MLISNLGLEVLATNNKQSRIAISEEAILKEELIKELKFLFTEASTYQNGRLTINHQVLIDKFGEEQAYYIAKGIEVLYQEPQKTSRRRRKRSVDGFVECMKDGIIGMILGVSEARALYRLWRDQNFLRYLKSHNWGAASKVIIEKLGVGSLPASIIAKIGFTVVKCSFELPK